MELSPPSYVCSDHGEDLTEAVREKLEETVPVAFAKRKSRRFAVIVTCPGQGTSHRLRFDGEVVEYAGRGGR